MTTLQKSCLLFLQKYIAENGYAPTFTTIAAALEIERLEVFQILNALIDEGRITIDAGGLSKTVRIIRPIIEGEFYLFDSLTKELVPYVRASHKESASA